MKIAYNDSHSCLSSNLKLHEPRSFTLYNTKQKMQFEYFIEFY